MPIGASVAGFFRGSNFNGRKIIQMRFNETYGTPIQNKNEKLLSLDDKLLEETNRKLDMIIQSQTLLRNEMFELKESSIAEINEIKAKIADLKQTVNRETSENEGKKQEQIPTETSKSQTHFNINFNQSITASSSNNEATKRRKKSGAQRRKRKQLQMEAINLSKEI